MEPTYQQKQQQKQQQRSDPPSVTAPPAQNMTPHQIQFLQKQGFPKGMIHALGHQRQSFPLRVWILDNSLYMKVKDAHILRGNNFQNVDASRWEELQDTVAYHAQMSATFSLPIRFAMLNDPQSGLPQYFTLHQTGNMAQEQQTLQNVMNHSKTAGPTLLTEQLKILRQYIVSIAPQLRAKQQTVPIILATQGLPTDANGVSSPQVLQEFILTLRSFESLPIWVVLRLCTDDEKAFEFFNSVDHQLQLPCDVLDDFYGEALEIYLRNPWLTYGMPLHRYRETGFHVRALDALDERALTLPELRQFIHFLFVDTADPAKAALMVPDPVVDWNGFVNVIHTLQAREQLQWNPVAKQVTPWINITRLQEIYGRQSSSTRSMPYTSSSNAYPSAQAQQQTQQPQPPQQQHKSSAPRATPASPAVAPIKDLGQLEQAISMRWAKLPPSYKVNKPIAELLGTVNTTFPLVDEHDYFLPDNSPPFCQQALSSGGQAVLKRAVRKMKFFLHPDKLPKDFNEQQLLLCKTLWDITAEAWDAHGDKN